MEPSTTRGNMGMVDVQVNMSPMASPDYEDGRFSSKGLELMRILELLYRNCGVVDLESLCLRTFKQVFSYSAHFQYTKIVSSDFWKAIDNLFFNVHYFISSFSIFYFQVWQIRIDVHVLASDGSLVDCACIASLTALAHFRRPDVSVLPDSIIIASIFFCHYA